MKRYIGTKIVLGEPMTGEEFAFRTGRHVGDGDGYRVRYEDGYTSWSPKDVFERCYRLVTSSEVDLIENPDPA